MDPVLPELKKLRLLSKKRDDIPQARAIAKTRKYLMAIGDKIAGLPDAVSGIPTNEELWSYVSDFTQNEYNGDRLQRLYLKLEAKRGRGGDIAQDDGIEDEVDAEVKLEEEQPREDEYEEDEDDEYGGGGSAEEPEVGVEPEYDDDYDPDD